MLTLGLICLFLSFILVIMGLLAWGAASSAVEKEARQNDAPATEQKGDLLQ